MGSATTGDGYDKKTALLTSLTPGILTPQLAGICLETAPFLGNFRVMTFAEIKPRLDELSIEEKRKLAAYLRHSLRADTEENRQELARRNREMSAGKIYDLAEVKATLAKLHGTSDAG